MTEVMTVVKEYDPETASAVSIEAADENAANSALALNSIIDARHPLQCRWSLWYLKGDRSKEWEDCLKCVATFDSVEEFWAIYNTIQPASGLNLNSDYCLFKEGIKPMWEDESNVMGGRWLMVIEKTKRVGFLDLYWLELLMAIVGEQFEEYGSAICGAVVNIRQKGDKVSLWTRDGLDDETNFRIGQILKMKLNIPDEIKMRYEVHKVSDEFSLFEFLDIELIQVSKLHYPL